MKKRLAILIGGEYRTFSSCFKYWKFLDNFDYDIFFSTWDMSNRYSDAYTAFTEDFTKESNPNVKESITADKILSVIGKQPKYLNIEKEIDFDHRGNKQVYHWQKLITALINLRYSYDYVIITRPDLIIRGDEFPNFILSIDPNNMYGVSNLRITAPPLPFVVTVHDIAFMSSPETLIKTLLPVPYMRLATAEQIQNGLGDCLHTHLAHYFVSNSIYVHSMNAEFTVNRGDIT